MYHYRTIQSIDRVLFLLWQRWKEMATPRENWGPALANHRLEAYETHSRHRTTFGGRLNPDGNIYQSRHTYGEHREAGEMNMYDRGAENQGFDNPL